MATTTYVLKKASPSATPKTSTRDTTIPAYIPALELESIEAESDPCAELVLPSTVLSLKIPRSTTSTEAGSY